MDLKKTIREIAFSKDDFDKYLGYSLVGVNYKVFRRNLIAAMDNTHIK